MSLKKIALIALTSLSLLSLSACNKESASSGNASSDAVKARQDLMKEWRAANDIIKGMAENPASFDAATLKEQAAFLESSKSQMWAHFADSANKGKSNDSVWSDASGFKAASDKFDAAVANLNTAAQNASSIGDVEAAIGQVGESCGSCHKVYKQ